MSRLEFKSLIHLVDTLQTDQDCRVFLEEVRWNGIPICPHCGCGADHYKIKQDAGFKGKYKCQKCRKCFTVTSGTMFDRTHVPLRKWFLAIYYFTSHKKGISSIQLSKDIEVTQKTAWYMLGRMRRNFKSHKYYDFGDETQVDETYIGGKTNKKNRNKREKGTQGRSLVNKIPVFGLISADGMVQAMVVPHTKARILKPLVKALVKPGSVLVTDGLSSYKGLNKDYDHKVVVHSQGEYVREDGYHTNSIENFWSHLKRGLNGIYHWTSKKHLQSYCDEFSYRWNTRKISDGERFFLFLSTCYYKLQYKDLIA